MVSRTAIGGNRYYFTGIEEENREANYRLFIKKKALLLYDQKEQNKTFTSLLI